MNIENLCVLLTGGAGFIGSNIAKYLLENNVKFLRIVDNLSTGSIENIQYLLDKYDNIEFFQGDITNYNTCDKCMDNIDVVCHQAALGSVPRSINDPMNTHNSNVNGFFNILLAAKENQIKRVVYASSSSVYGDCADLPKVESNKGKVLSPYAATKAIGDIYGWIFANSYQMETIGLIYFNVFGPQQNPNGPYAAVIPLFIKKILDKEQPIINGDGSYSRDFTYIDNVVLANVLALTTTNSTCFGDTFNIGAGGRVTILEMLNTIKKNISDSSEIKPILRKIRPGDIPHSNANIDKAKKELNYKVVTSFDDGIRNTIDYYKYYKN